MRAVFRVLGLAVLKPSQARAAGFELRPVGTGRRGPLRLLTVEAVDAARHVRDEISRDGRMVGAEFGAWAKLPIDVLDGRGFLPCVGGRGGMTLCPHHGDTDPSLRLFGSGLSGAGYCHGCSTSMHWTTAADGSTWVRPARKSTRGSTAPRSSFPFGSVETEAQTRIVVKPPAVLGGVRPGGRLGAAAFVELAGVPGGYVAGSKGVRGLKRTWARPVLETLVWADRSGPATERAAHAASCAVLKGAHPEAVLPDRFLSVSPMRAASVDLRPIPRGDQGANRAMAVPTSFRPLSQEWVLVDVDDIDAHDSTVGAWREISTRRIARVIQGDPLLTGRCAVVETSPTGVQVWAELSEVQSNPREWWARRSTRTWYSALAAGVLASLRMAGRVGGHIDTSAASAGRYGRRPGWRLVDGLWPYRARLIACVEDPVRGIEDAREIRARWLNTPPHDPRRAARR
jgi:hypothetical protein